MGNQDPSHDQKKNLQLSRLTNIVSHDAQSACFRKTREGCGCPKLVAGRVFRQSSTLLENYSPIFRQREMLSLPRFGHFPARKMAAGKSAPPSGTLLDFLLRDRHSLLEFSSLFLAWKAWRGILMPQRALRLKNFNPD